jgi:hypothetical protein
MSNVPAGDGDWITAFEIRRLFGADLVVEREARELWENATLRSEMSNHGGDLSNLVYARRRFYDQVLENNMKAYDLARAYLAGAHYRLGTTNFYWWPKIIEGAAADSATGLSFSTDGPSSSDAGPSSSAAGPSSAASASDKDNEDDELDDAIKNLEKPIEKPMDA